MYIIRPATEDDLGDIYDMQDVPFRHSVFVKALPPREEFLQSQRALVGSGDLAYFMFQQDGVSTGYILLETASQSPAIWGRWLGTLVYNVAKVAFHHLGFSQLDWHVRGENARMTRVMAQFGFRIVGTRPFMFMTPDTSRIAVGSMVLFQLTAGEFRENDAAWRKWSLPVEFVGVSFPFAGRAPEP